MFIRIRNILGNHMAGCLFNSLITGMLLVHCAGCSTRAVTGTVKFDMPPDGLQVVPSEVTEKIKDLEKQHERNAVINFTDIAVSSIRHRHSIPENLWSTLIDQSLDSAMRRIEDVYADNPAAEKARSLWHDEASKDFKGEPYERAFVFMLRGFRYYENGDYDNAIACFKSSILQDSLALEGIFNADMALAEWMIGLCHLRQGEQNKADEAFIRARSFRPTLKMPREFHNTIIVFFAGDGPVKARTGKYEEILLFEEGFCGTLETKVSMPIFGCPPSFRNAVIAEDFFYQAITRGGRAIDEINKYKSTVKDNTKIIGTIAVFLGLTAVGTALLVAATQAGGASLSVAFILGGIGLGLIALGVGAHVVAKMVKTKADVRAIASVPSRVYIWSGNVLPGEKMLGICTVGVGGQKNMIFHEAFIRYGDNHNVVYVFNQ